MKFRLGLCSAPLQEREQISVHFNGTGIVEPQICYRYLDTSPRPRKLIFRVPRVARRTPLLKCVPMRRFASSSHTVQVIQHGGRTDIRCHLWPCTQHLAPPRVRFPGGRRDHAERLFSLAYLLWHHGSLGARLLDAPGLGISLSTLFPGGAFTLYGYRFNLNTNGVRLRGCDRAGSTCRL